MSSVKKERQARVSHTKRLESNLADFFREAWAVLEPGRQLHWSWHYDLLCEYLGLIRARRFRDTFPDTLGLIINVPPRTAKSSLVTVCFPVWCWIRQAQMRFSCYSYSMDLSTEHSVKRRRLIQSAWFQEKWGHLFQLTGDQNLKTHFDNDRTGQMIATSVGGTATGKGGDCLILDDPLNPEQAASDTERKNANDWIDNTLRSRMNDMSSDVLVLVMQRLHEIDPTGYLLSQNPGKFIHLSVPLEEEGVKTPEGLMPKQYVFPLSGRVVSRPAGDILMPAKFPLAAIEALKVLRLVWAGQFQQRPAPLEGNLIKRADVRYYGGIDPETGLSDRELPEKFDLILISVDAAFKDEKTSDYVAILAVGLKGPDRFELELVNKHLDADATEKETNDMRKRWRASVALIEDKANGSAVIKRLKQKVPGIIAVNPEGGKISRFFAAAPEWQAGNWYVPRNAAWAEPHVVSLITFPNARYDDDADAMSQASIYLQSHGYGLFAIWREQAEVNQAEQQVAKTSASLASAQKRDEGGFNEAVKRVQQAPATRGFAVSVKQDDACPICGNASPSRYGDGANRCGTCGNAWTTPGIRPAVYSSRERTVVAR
jgi:predicted phage terminase large subunit-like protein